LLLFRINLAHLLRRPYASWSFDKTTVSISALGRYNFVTYEPKGITVTPTILSVISFESFCSDSCRFLIVSSFGSINLQNSIISLCSLRIGVEMLDVLNDNQGAAFCSSDKSNSLLFLLSFLCFLSLSRYLHFINLLSLFLWCRSDFVDFVYFLFLAWNWWAKNFIGSILSPWRCIRSCFRWEFRLCLCLYLWVCLLVGAFWYFFLGSFQSILPSFCLDLFIFFYISGLLPSSNNALGAFLFYKSLYLLSYFTLNPNLITFYPFFTICGSLFFLFLFFIELAMNYFLYQIKIIINDIKIFRLNISHYKLYWL
jgi:hypothetical protein